MSGLTTCTLVLEFNYDKPGASLGSVWIFNGDGSKDLQKEEPMAELSNWVRIIGPIDYETAAATHAALKSFFVESGITVIDAGIAD